MATVQELLQCGGNLPPCCSRRDVEILLGHCLDKPRSWLYTWPQREVSAENVLQFEHLLARRSEGEPVAYLIGEREFWSLRLAVNNATLIPRPETEMLVSWALELPLPQAASVLDLGTGSGAIALAVASERPDWAVTALDVSAAALEVARHNAASIGLAQVNFLQSDWYEAVSGQRFALLLGNPPYIDGDDPHLAQGDLRYEPHSALVAPAGGLGDLRRVVGGAAKHLCAGGWLLLEHGFEQGPAVRDLLQEAGFSAVSTRRDLAGLERATGGRLDAD